VTCEFESLSRVRRIELDAFRLWTALKAMVLPPSVEFIDPSAFAQTMWGLIHQYWDAQGANTVTEDN
jgi:hypothetical protein